MAPVNGSSKPRRPGHSKQPSKSVVPAIPLPHVKRQAAAAAAAAASVADLSHDVPRSEKLAPDGASTPTAEGSSEPVSGRELVAESGSAGDVKLSTSSLADSQHTIRDNAVQNTATSEPPATNANANGAAAQAPPGSTATVTVEPETLKKNTEQPTRAVPSETPAAVNGAKSNEPKHKSGEHPTVAHPRSRPPPSVSPTRYHMPRPFQPAGRPPMGMMPNGDMHRGPKPGLANGPPHMHQAHPSNGSVHFGAFHGSASSSPAPPLSGGIAPPPGMPMPDGRQPYMPLANGFPPMPPYGPDMMSGAAFDQYGRPAMYPPMDAYPPAGNNFGPSTPHSFHDSHSSAQPDDNTLFNQYPPGGPRNGMVAPMEEMQHPNHPPRMYGGPEYPRLMSNHGIPPHIMPQADDADGIIGYLQQQFGSPELADCTLELRYLDDRAPPVRIPGHQILLCRSPQLSRVLRKQNLEPSPSDRSMQIILLETESKWVRSDSFYMAVQRLYGLPLLSIPPPRNNPDSGEIMSAGNLYERFEFALGYAAAGHLLGWSQVVRRGCEVVTHLLSWQTLEVALDFALDEYQDRGVHEYLKYNDGSRILLNAVVTFIVHNFPYNFTLDPTLPNSYRYKRLPEFPRPASPTPQMPVDNEAPTVAHGSSVQFGKGRRTQKLSGIRFGDLSLSDQKNGTSSQPEAKQEQPLAHEVLSRVLLNLPFTQLKMILESAGSGNVNGWANAEARYRIIKDAVVEREARRLRALDAVLSRRVPDAELIIRQLRSPEPQFLDSWSSLGWQEELLPYGNADGPSLGRKWVPLAEPQNGMVAAYP
ncbi:hypothetical protein HJFPF1_08822 [Paramyrothecium foliicola]|nr:hypothetical protein HJFPF1_08822 [Paramyrothecium foliicola]